MITTWFICPYNKIPGAAVRYCAMDDFTQDITATGGVWTESEILGNQAIVKIKAPIEVINLIAAAPGFRRLPKDQLSQSLADLPNNIKQAMRNELLDAGYSQTEVTNRFGSDLSVYTLGDVLQFMASRRLKPRYDTKNDQIVFDGPTQDCKPILLIDSEIRSALSNDLVTG